MMKAFAPTETSPIGSLQGRGFTDLAKADRLSYALSRAPTSGCSAETVASESTRSSDAGVSKRTEGGVNAAEQEIPKARTSIGLFTSAIATMAGFQVFPTSPVRHEQATYGPQPNLKPDTPNFMLLDLEDTEPKSAGSVHEGRLPEEMTNDAKSPTTRRSRADRNSLGSKGIRSRSCQPFTNANVNKDGARALDDSKRTRPKTRLSAGGEVKRGHRRRRSTKDEPRNLDSSMSTRSTRPTRRSHSCHRRSSSETKTSRRSHSMKPGSAHSENASDRRRTTRRMKKPESMNDGSSGRTVPVRTPRKKKSGPGRKSKTPPPRLTPSQKVEETPRTARSLSPKRPTSFPRKRISDGSTRSGRSSTGTRGFNTESYESCMPKSYHIQRVLQKEIQQALNESKMEFADQDESVNHQPARLNKGIDLSNLDFVSLNKSSSVHKGSEQSKRIPHNDGPKDAGDATRLAATRSVAPSVRGKPRRRRHISTRSTSH
ncbi:expressed unknown protein [Seminavis robusta]|uniref:Uncharacterized protein n=1 Tax=Seminavis robusta TaxID=568900 RepID=A0A9N8DQJ5_9STRA|nr:expressed unknown protein [Seminavis robusta]|eukprot:Sro186_g080720.1 n/a (487) ;mRNA; f:65490-66950